MPDHKCLYCDYTTYNKSHLDQHVSSRHTGEKKYKCSYCEYETANKSNLDRHNSTKHKDKESKKVEEPKGIYDLLEDVIMTDEEIEEILKNFDIKKLKLKK